MSASQGIPLRCTCAAAPMLAMCGNDPATGEPWVHIKGWKGQRLLVEAVVTSGVVKLKCRECLRWYRVRIVRGAPRLENNQVNPLDHL
jgi:hypothetical protein